MSEPERPEVATHVLVPVSTAEKLRELSKKTRITQSEFLREAVEDLLKKYGAEQLRANPGLSRAKGEVVAAARESDDRE